MHAQQCLPQIHWLNWENVLHRLGYDRVLIWTFSWSESTGSSTSGLGRTISSQLWPAPAPAPACMIGRHRGESSSRFGRRARNQWLEHRRWISPVSSHLCRLPITENERFQVLCIDMTWLPHARRLSATAACLISRILAVSTVRYQKTDQ